MKLYRKFADDYGEEKKYIKDFDTPAEAQEFLDGKFGEYKANIAYTAMDLLKNHRTIPIIKKTATTIDVKDSEGDNLYLWHRIKRTENSVLNFYSNHVSGTRSQEEFIVE